MLYSWSEAASAVQDKFLSCWRNSRQRAEQTEALAPHCTPALASCANSTIYIMCSVRVSLSKYTFIQLGNPGFAQATVPFAFKCFLLRKGPNWVETIVKLGVRKDIFNSESFLNTHGKKKKEKSLIINYSNVHSFLKHFKDVYIETRCLPHRQPPFLLILQLYCSLQFSQ